MEKIVKIDNMYGIEIPSILLDELELNKKDNLVITVDNGIIFFKKKD